MTASIPSLLDAADAGHHTDRIAILISFSGEGGVERMILNLAEGFAARGLAVDLLAIRSDSAHLGQLPERVRPIDLGAGHTNLALRPLVRYLRTERPRALLAAKDRAIRVAAIARRLAGVEVRLTGRLGTNLSAALQGKPALQRWLRCQPMRWIYPMVDRIVAVSEGVAEDTLRITGLPRERVTVVRNPVITPRLMAMGQEPVDHPWFHDDGVPVILGAGRLTGQKDFATLIRAFAHVRKERPARLVILGEGRLRPALEDLAAELGIATDVDLPGFAPNPYAYMARAAVFALSSRWEGSPNVLTEAMVMGTPVVATDCPSGPREILQGGRYGPLVAMGDVRGLAQAILDTLAAPPDRTGLQEAVREYSVEESVQGYLRALGFTD